MRDAQVAAAEVSLLGVDREAVEAAIRDKDATEKASGSPGRAFLKLVGFVIAALLIGQLIRYLRFSG